MVLIHFRAFWRQNYADLKSQMEQWSLLGDSLLKIRVGFILIVYYGSHSLEDCLVSSLSLTWSYPNRFREWKAEQSWVWEPLFIFPHISFNEEGCLLVEHSWLLLLHFLLMPVHWVQLGDLTLECVVPAQPFPCTFSIALYKWKVCFDLCSSVLSVW